MTHTHRAVDFSAIPNGHQELVAAVGGYVRGIRGPRIDGVSRRDMLKWFRATPEAAIDRAINDALLQSHIRIVRRSLGSTRRANGAYRYVACADVDGRG